MSVDRIPVVELFGPTIQGEGAVAGQISFFIRSFACSYRCTWCDSMHAVDPRQGRERSEWLLPAEIVGRVAHLAGERGGRRWVTLTGGDPCIWNMTEVVRGLHDHGFRVAVETQGALWQEWLDLCELVTVSPKPPSSGMADRMSVAKLQKYHARLRGRMVLKIVVFSGDDVEFAARIHKFLSDTRLYLSAGTTMAVPAKPNDCDHLRVAICEGFRWLCERVVSDPRLQDVVLGAQMHALAWGRDSGR